VEEIKRFGYNPKRIITDAGYGSQEIMNIWKLRNRGYVNIYVDKSRREIILQIHLRQRIWI